MVLPNSSRPKGPIKSERNKAANSSGPSTVQQSASTSSAFRKKRAQGKGPAPSARFASGSNSTGPKPNGGTPRDKQSRPQSAAQHEKNLKVEEKDSDDDDSEDEESDEDVRSKTALSLSNHELPPLAALVETLSQFRYLQRLELSSIQSSEASPSGLTNLAWLAKAVFRSSSVSKGKSRAFGHSLTWLNLSSNPALTSESCIGLEALEALCVLNLSHCALTTLPPSITPLRSLKALVLNNNSISSLPRAFPHLPELNSLILSHNQLTSLPASMPASLPALKKLSLSHNKLTGKDSLPDFSLCLALREVRLNDNPELEELPESVARWGKGADGKTAPGLELLELKDCGLDTWQSLSTFGQVEKELEQQPRLRRKGLTQLLLKGNGVAMEEDYKERILQVHPTLRVLDNERLQPRVKPEEREEKADKKTKGKDKKVQQRAQRAAPEVSTGGASEEEDDDEEAAQMAAEMRALRRGKPAAQNSDDEESEDDDAEAAQMAAEMRALRRGQDAPPKPRADKKDKAKANGNGNGKQRAKTDSKKADRDRKSTKPASQEEEEERSKPKHKRGSRAGKKVKKDSRSEGSTEQAKPKKDPKDKNGGFFEEIDAAAEKVRLAPIYELSKKKAKIASGRTEVSAGVLEDTTSTLSKARQKEAKSRMELDSFDDNAAAESLGKGKNAKSSKKVTKGEDGDKEDKVVNTSVAGIIDLRKQKGKDGKKRKAEPANKGEKKKPRASLPFSEKQVQDAFGSGGDAWGNAGAWA